MPIGVHSCSFGVAVVQPHRHPSMFRRAGRGQSRSQSSSTTTWRLILLSGAALLLVGAQWFLPPTPFAVQRSIDHGGWSQVAAAELPVGVEERAERRGSLVIMGGSERFDNRVIWSTIVDLAGGERSRIAVFPTASGMPVQDGEDVVRVLNEAGADAFVVPVALRGFNVEYQEAVRDEQLVESVGQATGVFFVGGDQGKLRRVLVEEDGRNTPLLSAVWSVYRKGGVVAGTSAGAAVMSRIMFRSAPSVLNTLLNGVKLGREIDYGFGFLDSDWFVDQHCLVRGRFARALVAMKSQGIDYGLGIDEDTALVVKGDVGRVIGYRGVLLLDLSEAKSTDKESGFNVRNVRLSYLDRGDELQLRTLQITPSPEKQADRKVDPQSPDFEPRFRQKVFSNDILGNMAVHDLMCKLLDNRHDEAVGLAFDGAAALASETDGFEFRFWRAEDTHGWETGAFGGDDYTMVNLHLDINPIKIKGPLYRREAPSGN